MSKIVMFRKHKHFLALAGIFLPFAAPISLRGATDLKVWSRLGRLRTVGSRVAALIALALISPVLAAACELSGTRGADNSASGATPSDFRIELKPPNYSSEAAVQQHLVFSRVISQVLMDAITKRFRGKCGVVASASLFPDIRVSINSDGSDLRQSCSDQVKTFLSDFHIKPEQIEKASSTIALSKQLSLDNPAGVMIEAENILNGALTQIYDDRSPMHALALVDADRSRVSVADQMTSWLREQRMDHSLELLALVKCGADNRGLFDHSISMPYSGLVEPQSLTVSLPIPSSGKPRLLKSVVIVGAYVHGENTKLQSAATDKYCGGQSRPLVDLQANVLTVRILCLVEIVHNTDTWVVLFCDPKDCTSEVVAEKIATSIAADPDTIALARQAAEHDQQRGPYVVNINVANH